MPELSDVEGYKRYFNRHAGGRRIERVDVVDPAMLRGGSVRGLAGEVLGHARRHGKWLIADAGSATVLMHFGMTGLLRFGSYGDRHMHDRVVFVLDRGELRFRDMRKFGGVWVVRDQRGVLELSEQVRQVIQDKVYENLVKRRHAFA